MTIAAEQLIRTLLNNLEVLNDRWTLLSIVIGVDEDFEPNTTYGYVYDGKAGPPIAASADTIVQFNKDSGQYNIELEYGDEDRWQVTPGNLVSVRQELRPKL
ncbi:MAG: hypothetical protein DI498_02890 [Paracoccus denitrificans]|nr:MAG: hypothetical protein DI498_02890 [Paracoccus denitrificans]PZO85487.1 MAG: hypothetical protein DI633_02890 [Paracoccus denitrificans]